MCCIMPSRESSRVCARVRVLRALRGEEGVQKGRRRRRARARVVVQRVRSINHRASRQAGPRQSVCRVLLLLACKVRKRRGAQKSRGVARVARRPYSLLPLSSYYLPPPAAPRRKTSSGAPPCAECVSSESSVIHAIATTLL